MKRRSLVTVLAFALALMLGVGSFAGSTVAWFTESIASPDNKLQAGTLDVELEHYNSESGAWEEVGPTTELVDISKLYMPGSVEVVFLKARNAGSLALKYKLGITAVNKTIGTSVNGDTIELTKFLQAGAWVLDGQQLKMEHFDSYSEALGMITADIGQEGGPKVMKPLVEFEEVEITDVATGNKHKEQMASVLLADRMLAEAENFSTEEMIALVFYMPASIKNEMNFRGVQPEIEIGVHLLAGQATVEADSFNNEYDAAAIYPAYSTHDALKNQPSTTAAEPAAEPDTAEGGTTAEEGTNP